MRSTCSNSFAAEMVSQARQFHCRAETRCRSCVNFCSNAASDKTGSLGAVSGVNFLFQFNPRFATAVGGEHRQASMACGRRSTLTANAKIPLSRPQSNRSSSTSSRQTCWPRKAFNCGSASIECNLFRQRHFRKIFQPQFVRGRENSARFGHTGPARWRSRIRAADETEWEQAETADCSILKPPAAFADAAFAKDDNLAAVSEGIHNDRSIL